MPSLVVQTRASQIQGGSDGRHLRKIKKNRHYLSNGLTDRHEIWYSFTQFDGVDPIDRYNFPILKTQDGGECDRHFEKSKNHHISATI